MNTKVFIEKNYLIILLIFLSIFSYAIGFTFDENSAGGGVADFNNTWRNLQMFESNDLLTALHLTASNDSAIFQSSRIPGVYIFHKYFNPFTNNAEEFRLSVTFFSLLIPIFFFKALTLKFSKIRKIDLALLASLIFLSPYYRTSAYWGNEENFGILMVIFSYIFLKLYFNSKTIKSNFFHLTFLGLFSSLCIYFDQKLAFIPLVCLFLVLNDKRHNFEKTYLCIVYFIFSLPILYLFNLWGGILPPIDAVSRDMSLKNYNFQHLGYSLSIIFFYILPFYLFFERGFNYKNFSNLKRDYNQIIYLLLILYFIYFIFIYNFADELTFGNGVFFKLSSIIFQNEIFRKIFLSSIFFIAAISISQMVDKDYMGRFILLFIIFSSIIYKPVLQEYFDPLIIILAFSFISINASIKTKGLVICYLYFLFFLIFSNFYYLRICSTSSFC